MNGTTDGRDRGDRTAEDARGDWEGRHARTRTPGAKRDSPAVRIAWDPDDGEWDVRHAHVRRLAEEEKEEEDSGRLL